MSTYRANPSIRIREATRDDIKGIALFQVLMAAESEGLRLEHDTVVAGVTHIFDEPGLGFYLIAEDTEAVAHAVTSHGVPGMIACTLVQKEWSDWRNRLVLWIHSLYVMPDSRKKGIFRAIYQNLRERVEADPALGGIRLYVDRRNQPAQKAYAQVGMTNEHYELYEWLKT